MPASTWDNRYTAWFNWYESGGGPYFNGGGGNPAYDYYIKNYNYASNPAYNHDGATMLTLSEGQSYGMLYALMADNVRAFAQCYTALNIRHELRRQNINESKPAMLDGTTAWPAGYPDFMDSAGRFILDDKGANAGLKTFGWIWSANYNPGSGATLPGLSSLYMAPDGDVVAAACLLMAYERWNVPGWRDEALAILADLAEYGVRIANTRPVLTMGQYRGAGGFMLPYATQVTLDSGTVFPTPDQMVFDAADLTTGDAVRLFLTSGSVAPGGLSVQDSVGSVWPKYYIRVNDPFNVSFYPTKNDAIADTNKVNITSVGSGSLIVYPYETQAGQVATNPSYMFPPFMRVFAKYDTANAALWNQLADSAYSDIEHSCTLNYWNMPTYLDGVNIQDGTNAFFRAGGDSRAHNADAFRVALNMAFDGSTDALDVLKTQCTYNGTTLKWEPKTGRAGGIWRFYVDTGFLPFTLGGQAPVYEFDDSNIDTVNDRINLSVDWVAGTDYTNPIRIFGAVLETEDGNPLLLEDGAELDLGNSPAPLNPEVAVYPRKYSGTVYTLHPSRADALANTNTIDLTGVGSGLRKWALGYVCTVNLTTDEFTLNDPSGAFRTGEDIRMVPGGGTLATGIGDDVVYFGRLTAKNKFTLHPTLADATANTNKVNVTALGTGELVMTKNSAAVGWYYRGAIGDITEMSPYGAAQVLAYKYALNGYTDAEAFYDTLPSWIQQGGDGSFVEANGDYYVQHGLGWMSGIMSGRAKSRLNGRGYLVFESTEQATASALQNQLAGALGVSIYATVLRDAVSGRYAVPIVGVNAFNALSPTQLSAIVKQLPTGQWRANL